MVHRVTSKKGISHHFKAIVKQVIFDHNLKRTDL